MEVVEGKEAILPSTKPHSASTEEEVAQQIKKSDNQLESMNTRLNPTVNMWHVQIPANLKEKWNLWEMEAQNGDKKTQRVPLEEEKA